MKHILTFLAGTLYLLPCLLIFNESDTFVPNFIGFAHIGIFYIASRTEIGKIAIREYYKACINISNMFKL